MSHPLVMLLIPVVGAAATAVGPARWARWTAFLFTLALTLSCIYRYFVARVALETTLGTALALVALDVVVGLLLTGLFDQLYLALL